MHILVICHIIRWCTRMQRINRLPKEKPKRDSGKTGFN